MKFTCAKMVLILAELLILTISTLEQVQINLPNGKYVILDDVFVKTVREGTTTKYKLIACGSKFSKDASWTTNQSILLENINTGGFSLRSTRQEITDVIDPNIPFTFEKVVKIYGNGAEDIVELVK